jgi:hypothetical protein
MKSEQLNFISKDKLEHAAYYKGVCRNASIARWDAVDEVFWHWRTKLGSTFTESINHPEDDDGFDMFYPISKIEGHDIPMSMEVRK